MGAITDFFLDTAGQSLVAYAGRPQQTLVGAPTGYPPGGGFADMGTPGGGIPGFDFIPEPSGGQSCGPKPVYKYSCGGYRWVYPKRRRRKQLLTNSDAAGLAKLKGLVGAGKTMDTWIATHS